MNHGLLAHVADSAPGPSPDDFNPLEYLLVAATPIFSI